MSVSCHANAVLQPHALVFLNVLRHFLQHLYQPGFPVFSRLFLALSLTPEIDVVALSSIVSPMSNRLTIDINSIRFRLFASGCDCLAFATCGLRVTVTGLPFSSRISNLTALGLTVPSGFNALVMLLLMSVCISIASCSASVWKYGNAPA